MSESAVSAPSAPEPRSWLQAIATLAGRGTPATMEPSAGIARKAAGSYRNVEWIRNLPYFFMHAACLGVVWVGFSWTAAGIAAGLYVVRMFFITGFYHRYFSHRTFRVSRPMQFWMAVCGLTCVQRGPLWWAAHHRYHHAHSDDEEDLHSPSIWGVIWSHMFWFTTADALPTRSRYVRDLERFPELVWLDRHEKYVYIAFAWACLGLGCLLHALGWQPALGYWQAGLQILVWGFFVSTVMLYHGTYTINSLSHLFGSRRFDTADTSRNNWLLAIVTMGEGWHNNHHHYQASARQGFYWWEWDPTFYILKAMSWAGLVKDLRGVPDAVRNGKGRRARRAAAATAEGGALAVPLRADRSGIAVTRLAAPD